MSSLQQCPPDCLCACHSAQNQSHIGAVHILHAVTGGIVEYLTEKGDPDGERLAAAILNVNRLLRATLPAGALANQRLNVAFTTVSDAKLRRRRKSAE